MSSRSRMTLSAGAIAIGAVLPSACAPQDPDLVPFAEAVIWLGKCLVVSSLIWAVAIVVFGRSRK